MTNFTIDLEMMNLGLHQNLNKENVSFMATFFLIYTICSDDHNYYQKL